MEIMRNQYKMNLYGHFSPSSPNFDGNGKIVNSLETFYVMGFLYDELRMLIPQNLLVDFNAENC